MGGGISRLELYWKMSRFEADVTLGVLSLTFFPASGREDDEERLSPPRCTWVGSGEEAPRALTFRLRAAWWMSRRAVYCCSASTGLAMPVIETKSLKSLESEFGGRVPTGKAGWGARMGRELVAAGEVELRRLRHLRPCVC